MTYPIAPARTIYVIPSTSNSGSNAQRTDTSQRVVRCLPDQQPNEWEMVNGKLVPIQETPND